MTERTETICPFVISEKRKEKSQMKLFAPEYYKDFVCIADRCRHSCCVGWEIDIDEDTADMYKTLTDGYGKKIKESVAMTDVPHFKLEINDRCPHLDASGLCRIIT